MIVVGLRNSFVSPFFRKGLCVRQLRTASKMPDTLKEVLSLSIATAKKAGSLVKDIMSNGDLDIVKKSDENDLQTVADRLSSDVILMSLKMAFPGLTVISEEGKDFFYEKTARRHVVTEGEQITLSIPDRFLDVTLKDLTVWVDPLDGTKEYTDGYLDRVTILIGIAIGSEAVAGVVHQPYFEYDKTNPTSCPGRTISGIVGSGVGIESKPPPPGKKIIVTTRSHGSGLVDDVVGTLNPTEVLKVGGAGNKVLMLIDGKAHAYVFPSPGCKKWDTCAPEALLRALGGNLTDIRGCVYPYGPDAPHVNEWGVLATAPVQDHQSYVTLIPETLKSRVRDKNKK